MLPDPGETIHWGRGGCRVEGAGGKKRRRRTESFVISLLPNNGIAFKGLSLHFTSYIYVKTVSETRTAQMSVP